jgi:hypothetical protein
MHGHRVDVGLGSTSRASVGVSTSTNPAASNTSRSRARRSARNCSTGLMDMPENYVVAAGLLAASFSEVSR